jgi:hypothetical protein
MGSPFDSLWRLLDRFEFERYLLDKTPAGGRVGYFSGDQLNELRGFG